MKLICDFHIHSQYARWCSNKLNIENIWKNCIFKWIDVIWTWDFTHPKWLECVEEFLETDWKWLLIPKEKYRKKRLNEIDWYLNENISSKIKKWNFTRFIIQTEINNIFQRWSKKSRIHNCFLIDNIENAKKILTYLSKFWKVDSDGRLWVKQDQIDTLFWLKSNFPSIIFFPAHIWTPYFWVVWSKFWFPTLKEWFWKSLSLIDAIESWLSSDPIMNFINTELDFCEILSNSDAHSIENFAREWNIFEWISDEFIWYKDIEKNIKLTKFNNLWNLLNIIEKGYLIELMKFDSKYKFLSTIEFFPQEWKYFWDWHSKCNLLLTPNQTIKLNWICPICWWKIVIWVNHTSFKYWNKERITKIWYWDKTWNYTQSEIQQISKTFNRKPFFYIVLLNEIIKECFWLNKWTKWFEKKYFDIIKNLSSDFDLILNYEIKKIYKYDNKLWQAIEKIRNSDICISPWFDWNFWQIKIFWNSIENKPIDISKIKLYQNWLF